MRRLFAITAIGVAALLMAVVPANAQEAYGGGDTLSGGGTANTVGPGGDVTFSAPDGSFLPEEPVDIYLNGNHVGETMATPATSPGGAISFTINAGDLGPGCYPVDAVGRTSGNTFSSTLCVSGGAASGALAFTGNSSGLNIGLGAALLALGAGLVIFTRRRRAARLTA